ncbi:hypothetical protein ACFXOS_26145 [Streptomyces sp. NPDC059175]|uniref:hypothetical protein n=1 Tax=Streptomyces sp. NPDC059175 TaxID=3346757 RepID=UPI0036BE1DC6
MTAWQPDRLGVHRAVQEHDGMKLPPYIERDHDGELRSHLHTVASAGAGMVVVRGDSCTGKTRSAWEAVTACVPDWQLLYPKSAAGLRSCLQTNVLTGPTVIWLDNAHHLFAEADGNRAAEDLLALLEQPPAPVIVLATMWPTPLDAPGTNPKKRGRTRHIHSLLDLARTVHQPSAFDTLGLNRFETQARSDGQWTQAAAQARANGELCQRLAAAPELLDRYRHADHTPGQAVVTAAVEGRRLGVRGSFPWSSSSTPPSAISAPTSAASWTGRHGSAMPSPGRGPRSKTSSHACRASSRPTASARQRTWSTLATSSSSRLPPSAGA